jgi:hypothetical protein
MHDNFSPEERLLRLIRGEVKKTIKKDEGKLFAFDVMPSKQSIQHSHISIFSKLRHLISFNLINHLFLFILLILAIYLTIDFFINRPGNIERRIITMSGVGTTTALEVPQDVETEAERDKPISYYIQAISSKNIFTADLETKQTQVSPTFVEMVSKLKLQGIISGFNPQAVIQDTESKKTYFLSPGEYIGEIELRQILPGKVKLGYYDQEMELAL